MKRTCIVGSLLLTVLLARPTLAAPPATITYQGFLTTAAGEPVTTPVAMNFAVYTDPSGGTPLWSEHHASETVTRGVYSVVMGSVNPINLPFDRVYYLGVAIGSDPEMTPRQALSSVPSAFRALIADKLGQVCADGELLRYSQASSSWSCSTLGALAGVTGATGPTGATGATGATGPAGAAGANGLDGKTIRYGALAPTAAVGVDGDFYINSATSTIFGPKASGLWPSGTALVGPQGATGPAGPAGVAGAAGPQGAAGSNGSTGAIGPQGPIGLTGPAGPGLTWSTVTGFTQTAAANVGYIATNPSRTSITLPASPAVGDRFSVIGAGAGGWQVIGSGSQSIITNNSSTSASGISWTAHDAVRNSTSVATSSDGVRMAAATAGGQIYTSADSGATWTLRGIGSGTAWTNIASSADGSRLVIGSLGGNLFTSADFGATWTPRDASRNWGSVASSADGAKLVASTTDSGFYSSTDFGVTWTLRGALLNWRSLGSSSDGTQLVGIRISDSEVYTSNDSGNSWAERRPPGLIVTRVACSSDGAKLVAILTAGQISTSTDFGATWTQRESIRDWNSVASSGDGSKLVATVAQGQIYTSTDSGVNWTARDSNRNWVFAASSSDGSKLAAIDGGLAGQLYTSALSVVNTPTESTTLTGEQWSSIDLVYVGNNHYVIVGSSGR
jgi:hypothetical protein